jgi:hypothetical protein
MVVATCELELLSPRLTVEKIMVLLLVHLTGHQVDVLYGGPLVWVGVDALGHQATQLVGVVVGGKGWVVALLDLLAKGIQVHFVAIERRLQCCHFIEEAAQRPDVRLEVVAVLMDALGRHVVRGANQRVGRRRLGAEESTEAEVAQFDNALARDEYVGRFNI